MIIIICLFLTKTEITFVFSVFSFKTANGLEVADSTMAVWTCPIVYLVNDITVVPHEREFEFEFEYVIFPSLLLRLSSKLWSICLDSWASGWSILFFERGL